MNNKLFDLLFNKWFIIIVILLAILIDFLVSKYVYHDLGCMVAECRKFKP